MNYRLLDIFSLKSLIVQTIAFILPVLKKNNLSTVYAVVGASENLQLKTYFCGYQNCNFI